jgi:hypothetical protein
MTRLFIMFQKEPSGRLLFINRRLSPFLLLPVFLFSFFPLNAKGQINEINGNPILFRGIVFDNLSQEPLSGVKYLSDSIRYTDAKGVFSFYARTHDTVRFEHEGYRIFCFYISDTLKAREYTSAVYMNRDTLEIGEVVIIPSIGSMKYEILAGSATPDVNLVNAKNNIRISTYQGLVGMNKLGDPSVNYRVIQQQQKIDAYEKGGIPSAYMVSISPLTVIPVLYLLIKGLPVNPTPPKPYLSAKELEELKEIHKSMFKDRK